ncbi:Na(+)/H(+) exchanger beta-like [Pecten maximus]|uniref:Na(+)/H(+) exchanger beta-like n=1 Tax=Pecten maximus TaxID=6579 RepID=UPI001458E595|nr:Na(+)/H(+) exchanger beta-like [Pecten maximus]
MTVASLVYPTFCVVLVVAAISSTFSASTAHPHIDHVTSSINHSSESSNSTESNENINHTETHPHVEVFEIRYHDIREPFLFTLVVLVAAISKIGFHYANKLSSIVPESCLLCIVGTVFGAVIFLTGSGGDLRAFFTPDTFFNYLLPPIILESAFCLYDRAFTDNIGTILIFAVFGTIASCSLVGLSLIGLQSINAMEYIAAPVQLLVFSALIVAVDPVAVLAVFNEVGVNRVLYFLVFGESLLNDGVTVVLYNVLQAYNLILKERAITLEDILLGVVKFFVVCFGGLAVGLVVGVLCSLLTKYTNTTKVIEPVVIFGMAYTAFLVAEMFHFSGIISLIGCGLIQMAYSLPNLTNKSQITVKFFSRVLSTTSEIIIFLFLGLLVVRPVSWSTALTLWTVLLITAYRFLVVFSFSSLINRFDRHSVRKIRHDEMFIMSYGGIRGAVCFSLVALLDKDAFPMKDMFVTSTLFVIFFTVFIQGATIRPFVTLLRVKLASKSVETSLVEELMSHVNDHVMAGIELIIGNEGRNSMREWFYHWDEKYIRSILLRDHDLNEVQYEILQCYEKLVMKEHYKNLHMSGAKNLPKAADTLRNVDSSAIIRQIRRNSILPVDTLHEVEEDETESDNSSVKFTLDPAPSSPMELRKFLDKNAHQRRPSLTQNIFGFNKASGLKMEDRRKIRRPSITMLEQQWANKRQTNIRLQSTTFMRIKWERPKSWSEEDAVIAQQRGSKEIVPEQRRRAMTVDPTSGRNTRPRLHDLKTKPIMESVDEHVTIETDNSSEADPLLATERVLEMVDKGDNSLVSNELNKKSNERLEENELNAGQLNERKDEENVILFETRSGSNESHVYLKRQNAVFGEENSPMNDTSYYEDETKQ